MENIIYTSEILGYLHLLFKILMIVGWAAFLIDLLASGISEYIEYLGKDRAYTITFISIASVAIISTLLFIFVPSKKTYLRMNAGKIVEELKENSYWERELPKEMVIELKQWVKENEQK